MVERPDRRPDHQAQARQATDVRQSKDRFPSGKIERRDLSGGEHHRDCVRARLWTLIERRVTRAVARASSNPFPGPTKGSNEGARRADPLKRETRPPGAMVGLGNPSIWGGNARRMADRDRYNTCPPGRTKERFVAERFVATSQHLRFAMQTFPLNAFAETFEVDRSTMVRAMRGAGGVSLP